MAPSALLTTLLLSLAFTLPATAAPHQGQCPLLLPGLTTTVLPRPTALTTTYYAGTFYDGVFLNCHGHTAVTAVTAAGGVRATQTVSQAGTVTSASYVCSATKVPTGCPTPS